jgi:multidrug efflux pump subunit AcrA (membrane-fusion protein)
VTIRKVTVGERSGSLWIIRDGLKADEHVISEGTQKVREGSTVKPKLVPIPADTDFKAQ